MLRLLHLENVKTIAITSLPKRQQKYRNILYKSSNTRDESTTLTNSGKKPANANKEVFFPPVRHESLKDKIALVAGGTEGIGLRCVRELLTSGAKGVMIADVDQNKGYSKIMEFSKEYGQSRVAFIQINPNYLFLKNAFISTINFYKGLNIVINCINLKEKNWEDQVDENIKEIVLSTQLCLEFMGRNNGGNGGILVNIVSDYEENAESCALHLAVQDFIVRFDHAVATQHFNTSNVKVLTICRATLDMVGCDLATVLSKGPNGCVWMPS